MAAKKRMKKKSVAADESSAGLAPSSWALIAPGAATVLLLYAGFSTENWRGVWVSEVQVLAVGGAAWLGLRS